MTDVLHFKCFRMENSAPAHDNEKKTRRMERLFDDSIPLHTTEAPQALRVVTIPVDVPLVTFRCFSCLAPAAFVSTCSCYTCRTCYEKKFEKKQRLRTGLVRDGCHLDAVGSSLYSLQESGEDDGHGRITRHRIKSSTSRS